MIYSAVQQVQNDAQRLNSISSAYGNEWGDTVSERVFSGISALSSNASQVSSDLYNQTAVLESLKEELTRLSQF